MKVSLQLVLLSSSLLCTAVSAFTMINSHHHRQLHQSASANNDDRKAKMSSTSISSSLADEYAINTQSDNSNDICWDLIPISQFANDQNVGVGTLALKALNGCGHIAQQEGDAAIAHSLKCEWTQASTNTWSITVDKTTNDADELSSELDCILSRIMVQCAVSEITTANPDNQQKVEEEENEILLHVTLPLPEGQGCQKLSITHQNYSECVRHLFTPLNSNYAQMELVDMVNSNGDILGSLPRPYVHTYNILHRGIGMIVTNKSIFGTNNSDTSSSNSGDNESSPPDVYVHQRTSTKRVFPSLYDMFVGGVSTSGEDSTWTAAREVAEELGLKRALAVLEEGGGNTLVDNPLSEELFQCTICTSYNRCVVSMFAYTCDTSSETIEWQEEEVAWGGWVPYDVVEVAGKLSIDRLKRSGVWPGTGSDDNEDKSNDSHDAEASVTELKSKYNIDDQEQPWECWDFVPDGLLVWEAWQKWVEEKEGDLIL